MTPPLHGAIAEAAFDLVRASRGRGEPAGLPLFAVFAGVAAFGDQDADVIAAALATMLYSIRGVDHDAILRGAQIRFALGGDNPIEPLLRGRGR
ncbi:MAG: hypothetical protein GC206_13235 [Alphaproteobacteria bacterium]|nr:hypothetical protein [Alphaproteobacteria bacterium]